MKRIWVVADIYNEDDGYYGLVSDANWYRTEKEAKAAAEEHVQAIYMQILENQSPDELPFDQVFDKVDRKEECDWGWDPIDGSCCTRIRVFPAYREYT